MLLDPIDAPDETTAEALHLAYLDHLAAIVADVGVDEAADRTDCSVDVLGALVSGEHPDLTLGDAAAILALTDDWPDADVVMLEVRDSIMLGMSSAVLDVDGLERELDDDLDAKTIQQMIEGRRPFPLETYAAIALVVERENDYA